MQRDLANKEQNRLLIAASSTVHLFISCSSIQ